MADPVDTDALRSRADDDDALGYPEAAALQRAAADEVDRLRLSDSNATQQRDQLADALRRSDNENDRLRTVIESAPHALGCPAGHVVAATGPCTCWKADAL